MSTVSCLLLFATAAILPYPAIAQQQEPCRLEGQVVNSVTGEPVRKALLTLAGTRQEAPVEAVTDTAGRFVFADLAPGAYVIAAGRNGFQSYPHARSSRPEPLTLAPAERKTDLIIRMVPLGVITGRIVDEDGDPIPNVQVTAMIYRYTDRGRQLSAQGSHSTNDLGEYRIHSLPPGRYYVRAEPPSSSAFGYRTRPNRRLFVAAYYPGTPDAVAASVVPLNPGQQVAGIDLALRRGSLASVSGRLIRAEGATNIQVMLMQAMHGLSSTSSFNVDGPDGKFAVQNLTPGAYVLAGRYQLREKQYEARVPLQVGAEDIEGIELRPLPPLEIAGQVRVEGAPATKPSRLLVYLENEYTLLPPVAPSDTGAFAFRALPPGIYRFNVAQSPDAERITPLYLRAVRLGNSDITETGLDIGAGQAPDDVIIVMSANGGQVEGIVENDRSEPAANAIVTLVPAGPSSPDRLRTGFQAALTNQSGRFSFQGVPPGSYRVFAWEQVDVSAVRYDPDFIKPFESLGGSIQISDSAKENLTLKLIRLPEEN